LGEGSQERKKPNKRKIKKTIKNSRHKKYKQKIEERKKKIN